MITREIASRTPYGRPTVELLDEAYRRAIYFVSPMNQTSAELVRDRIAGIPFAPYWSANFEEWNESFSGNPVGRFALRAFQAAQTNEGEGLLKAVAVGLGECFYNAMFEGNVPAPAVQAVTLAKQDRSQLAQALIELREAVGQAIRPARISVRVISDSWIDFAQGLAQSQPAIYEAVLWAVRIGRGRVETLNRQESSFWDGMISKVIPVEIVNGLLEETAKAFASQFPKLVVSDLTPPNLSHLGGRPEVYQQASVV